MWEEVSEGTNQTQNQKTNQTTNNYNNNNKREYLEGVGCTFMDVDFGDSSSCWPPFDHHIPSSPLYQPYSPLWAFSDDFSRFPTSTTEPVVEKLREEDNGDEDEDDKKKVPLPPPFLPTDNFDVSFIVKERITQALRSFKESTEQHQILAQVWAPVRNGNRVYLTTSGQPFVLDPHSNGLNQYRTVSLMYMFAADTEIDGALGLPGRVYRHRLPEWTPNVQYYSSKEYNRVDHAKLYNVKGTLALPVFEPSRHSCLAVLELIMTSQKINYAPEVDKVCKALEAVNLKSSEILDHPSFQICNEGRQNALAEILEVLTEVCETYKLPLAQTWVPCKHRSVLANGGGLKKSCSSFDGSCMGQVCMSTSDVSFYIVDAHIWGFREACAEHHLQKDQGVAGRAFSSHGLSFCRNISNFLKIEYPLVHYARMFGLTGCFAICLRSKYTGDDDYVLEFFLPPSVVDSTEQENLLDSILATMKSDLQNLMVASGRALEVERKHMEIIEVSMDENHVLLAETNLSAKPVPVTESIKCGLPTMRDSLPKLTVEKDAGKSVGAGCSNNAIAPVENKTIKKTSERKRGKAEKQISLEVLQQYFAGSLKDAAKSLGVCPTTMKRICRQHGISRWPSRKINKVNRSLTKLKQVIESVQGADGTFSLTSLAPSTMPVPEGSTPLTDEMNGNCQQQSPTSKSPDIPDDVSELPKSLVNGQTNFRESCHEERIYEQNGFTSKAGSVSKEVSSGASTSHGSCHNSPEAETNLPNGQISPNFHEQGCNPTGFMFQQNGYPRSEAFFGTHSQELFNAMLVADAGSSKDLRDLECDVDEVVRENAGWTDLPYSNAKPLLATSNSSVLPKFASRQEMKSVTIKATFREDIIRFKLCLTSNIVELKEEVAKRLKLEVGTFEIKYMDDDHEWVLIACDSDLQECLDLSKSSGNNVIRLLIHDISVNLGSSCESSGE